jgi:hypothetical protein
MQNIPIRRIFSSISIAFGLLIIGYLVLSGRFLIGVAPDDFIAYWAAGRRIP